MSHTKDHWAIGIIGEESVEVINNEGCVVACVEHYPLMETARFIAAAPELLDALESFLVLYKQGQLVIEGDDGNDPVVAAALAAIAKAKGKN
jgi:hypothetical protein